jgi:hypothetical protein
MAMSELKPANQPQKPQERPKRLSAKPGTFKEKTLWQRIRETFFAKTAKDVGTYLWKDVMLPAIKKLVADGATNAVNMAIYGDDRAQYRNMPSQNHVSQSSVYSGRAAAQRQYDRSNRYNCVLQNCRPCSDKVLLQQLIDDMNDWMYNHGGKVSVEDLSYMVPDEWVFPVVYTDANWGWVSPLNYNCIVSDVGGYILDLPPARPLGR